MTGHSFYRKHITVDLLSHTGDTKNVTVGYSSESQLLLFALLVDLSSRNTKNIRLQCHVRSAPYKNIPNIFSSRNTKNIRLQSHLRSAPYKSIAKIFSLSLTRLTTPLLMLYPIHGNDKELFLCFNHELMKCMYELLKTTAPKKLP